MMKIKYCCLPIFWFILTFLSCAELDTIADDTQEIPIGDLVDINCRISNQASSRAPLNGEEAKVSHFYVFVIGNDSSVLQVVDKQVNSTTDLHFSCKNLERSKFPVTLRLLANLHPLPDRAFMLSAESDTPNSPLNETEILTVKTSQTISKWSIIHKQDGDGEPLFQNTILPKLGTLIVPIEAIGKSQTISIKNILAKIDIVNKINIKELRVTPRVQSYQINGSASVPHQSSRSIKYPTEKLSEKEVLVYILPGKGDENTENTGIEYRTQSDNIQKVPLPTMIQSNVRYARTLSTDMPLPKFIHSTYMRANRIGAKEINQSNYGKFSFIYLSAAPTWVAADFDKDQDFITEKYVTSYDYASKGLPLVPKMIEKAHSMGCRVLLMFAERTFNEIASNESRRNKFAKMMAQFVEKFNYDGIDLDWETTVTTNPHTLFMEAISRELNEMESRMGKSLYKTTALAEWHNYSKAESDALSKQVDWINVMTYDMGGGTWGSTPSHNAPLNGIKTNIGRNFQYFSPSKLCIGLANYGYTYKDLRPGVTVGKEVVAKQSASMGYTQFKTQQLTEQNWTAEWDNNAKANYYFSPDHKNFTTIEDTRSLDYKIEWIVQQGYLGEFWWVYDCDYIEAKNGEQYGTNTLIDHVEKRYKELVK